MRKQEIDKILNKLVKKGLGPEWSEYWKEEFKERTPRLKKHFMLNQHFEEFLTQKEYFKIRNELEAKLTEEEWLWLIIHVGIIQGKIEYKRRMLLHFPHLTSSDIRQKLGYK